VFGRHWADWSDRRGQEWSPPTSLGTQLRFALWYPRTADLSTVFAGGLLTVLSVLLVPAPLVYGYLHNVMKFAAAGQSAPKFWTGQWGKGLFYIVVGVAMFFGLFFGLVVVFALTLGVLGVGSDPIAGLAMLCALYATPAILAGRTGNRGYRAATGRALQWIVSLHYLATAIVVAGLLLVGYVATVVSVITIVGPLIVGFYFLMAIATFVAIRYESFEPTTTLTAADVVDPVTPDAIVDSESDESGSWPWNSGVSTADGTTETREAGGRDHRAGRAQPSTDQSGARQSTDASSTDDTNETDRSGDGEDDPDDEGVVGTDATSARDPGVYRSDTVRDRDGPIRYHDGEFVDGTGSHDVTVATPEPVLDDDAVAAFLQTGRKWASISQNEPIATVFETGEEDDPYVAFDDGDRSLPDALPALSPTEGIGLLADVAEALRVARLYSHRHGHLTPAAVHVTDGTERPRAIVSEWGLRRTVEQATGSDDLVTPYSAPEQVTEGVLGETVDVYQLGALACYVFTGRPPVDADGDASLADAIRDGERQVVADDDRVPEAVTEVVNRALSTDPDQRQDSVSDVENAFKRALE